MDTGNADIVTRLSERRHRLTVDEYFRMAEAGILNSASRVELIEGQIIDMAPIGPRHGLAVDNLSDILGDLKDKDTMVRTQNPVFLNEYNLPQPDISVVRRHWTGRGIQHPGPPDIHLLIEVAGSSILADCTIEAELYARFDIREYWIVDLTTDEVAIFRDPRNGTYASRGRERGSTILQVQALPAMAFPAEAIFA